MPKYGRPCIRVYKHFSVNLRQIYVDTMGKKNKDKKGKGAEKTAQKTVQKAEKKVKKLLKEKGEDDIEALIAEFKEKDKHLAAVVEEKCPPPSQRCNMSFVAHPDKDELIMFGGEYFNGNKTFMYNDLLFFSIKTKEWTKLTAPNAPTPRCAHQMVALSQGGGQLWMFGGEFASPTGSQFHHYKELWCFHLKEKRWQKVSSPGAPTARSGHRMAVCKRQLIVFGGFHDNVADYRYYNDVNAFNLDTFTWSKLTVSGQVPAARSACQLGVLHDQRHLLVYGGYSKERQKKDVDTGKVHSDMFMLTPTDSKDKDEVAPDKWKWTTVKQSGVRPSPRSGFSMVTTPGNRAVVFGGVFDKEEDEEHVEGVFYNEMYSLDLETGKWHELILRGKKDSKDKKRRRKKKDAEGGDAGDDAMEEGDEENGVDEEMEKMKVEDAPQQETTYDDGIFTVTMGPSATAATSTSGDLASVGATAIDVFMPCPRSNAALVVKHGVLYLYGGMYEDGDRQVTLADMYSLDLHRLDTWTTIIEDDISKKEWMESDSDSWTDDEEGAAGGDEDGDDTDEASDMEEEVPDVRPDESLNDFFGRTRDFWLEAADSKADKEGVELLGKALKKEAFQMAENHYKLQGK